jgi:hypothetical protein
MVCQLAQTEQSQHISSIVESGKSPTKTYTEQLSQTKSKRLFETAKPLFVGSFLTAAFNEAVCQLCANSSKLITFTET